MTEIELSNTTSRVKVDDGDWEVLRKYNWWAWRSRSKIYAVACINGREVQMHTFLMGDLGIDHKDRNGLNNQRNNLRKASTQQNAWNSDRPLGKLGIRGVRKVNKKFQAVIRITNKRLYSRVFDTPEEAGAAYVMLAKEHHGEFANAGET